MTELRQLIFNNNHHNIIIHVSMTFSTLQVRLWDTATKRQVRFKRTDSWTLISLPSREVHGWKVPQFKTSVLCRFLPLNEQKCPRTPGILIDPKINTYTKTSMIIYNSVVEHACNSGTTPWNSGKEGKEKIEHQ
jgi:hypothetical protein